MRGLLSLRMCLRRGDIARAVLRKLLNKNKLFCVSRLVPVGWPRKELATSTLLKFDKITVDADLLVAPGGILVEAE